MAKKLSSEEGEGGISSLPNVSLYNIMAIFANNKGGVGKTTAAHAFTDFAIYHNHEVNIAQIDRQERLSRLYDCPVVTIKSDPDSARRNPEEELGRFSPIMDWADKWHGKGPLILDLGANEVDRFSTWAKLCMFADELDANGTAVVVFIVFTAEEQSIQEARQTANALLSAFPAARIVYVENQRFGSIAALKGDAAASYRQFIAPALAVSPTIRIPMIPMNSYHHFEQSRLRFTEVAALSTADVMNLTGLAKANAIMARGDIIAWMITVFDRLDALFGLSAEV